MASIDSIVKAKKHLSRIVDSLYRKSYQINKYYDISYWIQYMIRYEAALIDLDMRCEYYVR